MTILTKPTLGVVRFFDKSSGTHFFGTDPAEVADIVATRSHFYTSDAGERASIFTTRADLEDEGIGFYAPSY